MEISAVTNVDFAQQAPPRTASVVDDEKLARARRQVAAIKGFYIHFAVYVLVLLGLVVVNVATGSPWWVQWVFLGWGIGVAAHALTVFGGTSKAIADWEERKVRQLMQNGR
jgi:hypothetical protein